MWLEFRRVLFRSLSMVPSLFASEKLPAICMPVGLTVWLDISTWNVTWDAKLWTNVIKVAMKNRSPRLTIFLLWMQGRAETAEQYTNRKRQIELQSFHFYRLKTFDVTSSRLQVLWRIAPRQKKGRKIFPPYILPSLTLSYLLLPSFTCSYLFNHFLSSPRKPAPVIFNWLKIKRKAFVYLYYALCPEKLPEDSFHFNNLLESDSCIWSTWIWIAFWKKQLR